MIENLILTFLTIAGVIFIPMALYSFISKLLTKKSELPDYPDFDLEESENEEFSIPIGYGGIDLPSHPIYQVGLEEILLDKDTIVEFPSIDIDNLKENKEQKMKINKQISDALYNRYLELLAQNKFKKGEIQKKLQEEFGLPRSSCWDKSVLRLKKQRQDDEKSVSSAKLTDANTELKISTLPSLEYTNLNNKKKTFIIAGWEIRVGINENFLKCVEKLKKELNAEALLVPVWHKDTDFIPSRLKEIFTVVNKNIKFNENLTLELIPSHALAQSPLSGWLGSFPGKSVILPGLIKEIQSEPSIHLCKQIMSTGSVGYLNSSYDQFETDNNLDFQKRWNSVAIKSAGKSMAIAQRFIKPGCLIIDVIDEKTFLSRYATMEEEGILYDLDKKITVKGVEKSIPKALVTGDYHAIAVDEENHQACKEMINYFQPEEVVLNDFFDGISSSYHNLDDAVFYSKVPSIKEEAEISKNLLKELTDISKRVIYLCGNHENFLLKLLSKPEMYWRMNGNLSTCYKLQAYTMDTGNHPIVELLELDKIDNLYFSPEKEIYHVNNVAVLHGHESFAKMSFKGFAKVYNKVVTGHFHKPEVWRNAVCVGATAKAEQSYSIGVNASIGANCLIQPDGSLQLLPIIRGNWLLKDK